jgi:hydroxypyruvate isomerase
MTAMPPLRFSVNVETIFGDLPFEQRLEHVADLGFAAFEFASSQGKDMNITLALTMALRLDVVAFVGSSASLVDPAHRAQFRDEITRAAALAVDLSCANLIVHSGPALPDVPRLQQHKSIIEGLRTVAPIAADAGITLVMEPLNLLDHPGTYLTSSDEGFLIIRAVSSPNVRLLYNVYHQQISEGNLSYRLSKNLDQVGHIRVADVPGRHEPGTGEINYEHIFLLLREHGYAGYVGLDYTPRVDPAASLRAVRAMSQ